MAGEAAITSANVVGWAVTGVGIVASLGWNLLNRWHSNSLAAEIRKEQHTAEQWSRLRTRIEGRLDPLIEELNSASISILRLGPADESKTAISLLDQDIVLKHDALARVLDEADRSEFCNGSDWSELAFGREYGSETSWDLVSKAFETAIKYPTCSVEHLKRLKKYADEIESGIRNRIHAQDAALAPRK